MKNRVIRIDIKAIFMLFMLIPFLKFPDYVVGTFINNVFDILKFGVIFLLIVFSIKNKTISNITLVMILFQFIIVISTYFNGVEERIWSQVVQLLSCLGIMLYCDYFIKVDKMKFLSVVSKYICVLCFISCISMIFYYPFGMYVDGRGDSNYYLFGLDNIAFFTFFIGLITLIIHSKYKKGYVSKYVYIFLLFVFACYFYVGSTTAYISLLLLFFGTFLIEKNILKLNYKLSLVTIALFFFVVCVVGVQHFFEDFIRNVLHKSITLTGRTVIWENAISYIVQKPLLGYGLEPGYIMQNKVGFNHIHNLFLESMYKGGIVLILVFIFMFILIGRKMKRFKTTKVYSLMCLFLITFLFVCQFDYYNDIYICFLIYNLLFNIDKFVFKEE